MHTRSNRDTESGFSPQTPYLADIGVINLVPEPWGGPWMRRHQILTRLSQYFNIVWCNPAPSWRKIGRRTPPPRIKRLIINKLIMAVMSRPRLLSTNQSGSQYSVDPLS